MKQKIESARMVKNTFLEYKIELENKELEKFEEFLSIFIEKNSKINLSAIREPEDIVKKHFLDSIILNIFIEFEKGSKVLDM
jgi:16S rRNA (guanine527-N7)-methyltransferase